MNEVKHKNLTLNLNKFTSAAQAIQAYKRGIVAPLIICSDFNDAFLPSCYKVVKDHDGDDFKAIESIFGEIKVRYKVYRYIPTPEDVFTYIIDPDTDKKIETNKVIVTDPKTGKEIEINRTIYDKKDGDVLIPVQRPMDKTCDRRDILVSINNLAKDELNEMIDVNRKGGLKHLKLIPDMYPLNQLKHLQKNDRTPLIVFFTYNYITRVGELPPLEYSLAILSDNPEGKNNCVAIFDPVNANHMHLTEIFLPQKKAKLPNSIRKENNNKYTFYLNDKEYTIAALGDEILKHYDLKPLFDHRAIAEEEKKANASVK